MQARNMRDSVRMAANAARMFRKVKHALHVSFATLGLVSAIVEACMPRRSSKTAEAARARAALEGLKLMVHEAGRVLQGCATSTTSASARRLLTSGQMRLTSVIGKEMQRLLRLVSAPGRRLVKSAPHEPFYTCYDGNYMENVVRAAKYSSEGVRYARIMVARAALLSGGGGVNNNDPPSVCFSSVESAIDDVSAALEAVGASEF